MNVLLEQPFADYNRWGRRCANTPAPESEPVEEVRTMTEHTCSVDGCSKPAHGRGWCTTHLDRWRKWGDPLKVVPPGPRPTPLSKRFWPKVGITEGCWIWLGARGRDGYGVIHRGGSGGAKVSAHRFSYEQCVGPIPEGLQIDHLCRNVICVNPAHLEPVTPRENVLRSMGLSAVAARRSHCINGHEYTPANTYRPPSNPNARVCRQCGRERSRRYREKASS